MMQVPRLGYTNSVVAAELGLQGQLKQVNVSHVLNGHIETFETTSVECIIESLDEKSQLKITAFTTERVIGDMKAIDWSMCAREWPHLQCLEFHKLGQRPAVDVLIVQTYTSHLKISEEHLDSQSMINTIRFDMYWASENK